MPRATISAITHYVPSERRSNAFYVDRLDTTDEWIQSRTGIRERRIAGSDGTSGSVRQGCRTLFGGTPDVRS